MKQTLFFLLLLLLPDLNQRLAAQTQTAPADTFRQERMKTYYGQERLKDQARIDKILLSINDPHVNADLKAAKSLEPLYWILAVGGAVMMGVGGYNSISGKLNNGGLYAGGGALMLGSGVVGWIGSGHRKKAFTHFNEAQRVALPVQPPIATALRPAPDSSAGPQTPAPQFRALQTAPGHGGISSVYGPATLGFAFGPGRAKQHINYEDAFDGEFLPARVFSFGLQYGKPISEHLAWQIELGLTQHGFRLKQTSYSYGVKVVAKADARVRYLELPFSLLYRQPVGKKGLTLAVAPGFSLGYATSAKIVTRASGKNDVRNVHTKIEDNVSLKGTAFGDRLDAALQLGTRGEYPLKPGKVFLELRYHLGILNLDRNTGDSQDKTFNRSWLLRLGYCYALK